MSVGKNKKGIPIILIVITIIIIAAILIISITLTKGKDNQSENSIKDDNTVNAVETSFRINNIICKNGDEISVEIEQLDDSDYVAANFEYIYDSNSLEYNSYEVGDSFSNAAMTIVNNDEKNGKVLIGFVANPEDENKSISER